LNAIATHPGAQDSVYRREVKVLLPLSGVKRQKSHGLNVEKEKVLPYGQYTELGRRGPSFY